MSSKLLRLDETLDTIKQALKVGRVWAARFRALGDFRTIEIHNMRFDLWLDAR